MKSYPVTYIICLLKKYQWLLPKRPLGKLDSGIGGGGNQTSPFSNLSLDINVKKIGGGGVFFYVGHFFSSGDIGDNLPKIDINLSRTYQKIHYKREPYRFSG